MLSLSFLFNREHTYTHFHTHSHFQMIFKVVARKERKERMNERKKGYIYSTTRRTGDEGILRDRGSEWHETGPQNISTNLTSLASMPSLTISTNEQPRELAVMLRNLAAVLTNAVYKTCLCFSASDEITVSLFLPGIVVN